jgi:hypothetical protein
MRCSIRPGIERQVPEDEVVGELKVAALAADLGADEQLCSVWFRKPGCLAVAMHKGQTLRGRVRRSRWSAP